MSNVSKEDKERIEKQSEEYKRNCRDYGVIADEKDYTAGAEAEHLYMKAENERLKEEVDTLKRDYAYWRLESKALQSKIERVKAECNVGFNNLAGRILDLLK